MSAREPRVAVAGIARGVLELYQGVVGRAVTLLTEEAFGQSDGHVLDAFGLCSLIGCDENPEALSAHAV